MDVLDVLDVQDVPGCPGCPCPEGVQMSRMSTMSKMSMDVHLPHWCLSAPQGCGKTTLTHALRDQFASEGLKCAVISLDDFYLPRSEQVKLAKNSGNELLKYRGNGTNI